MNTRLIGTFGSFPSDKEDYEKSDVVIIPMGYEESTCYIPGTKFGPSAIIEASHYLNRAIPLMITTAGTIPSAKFLIIGAVMFVCNFLMMFLWLYFFSCD